MPSSSHRRRWRRTGLATALCGVALLAVVASAPGAAAAAGAWRWPLDAPVTVVRGFEAPDGPYGAGHRGVDLAGRLGAPVRAAGAGTVVLAGSVAGRPVVVVAHGAVRSPDELRTTYEPVVASVEVGAVVGAGDVLGRLGDWPEHCAGGPCLHWGLRRGSAYLDPTTLLRSPVRLLPVGAPVERTDVDGVASRPTTTTTTTRASAEPAAGTTRVAAPSRAPTAVSGGVPAGRGTPSRSEAPALAAGASIGASVVLGALLAGRTRRRAVRLRPRGSSP